MRPPVLDPLLSQAQEEETGDVGLSKQDSVSSHRPRSLMSPSSHSERIPLCCLTEKTNPLHCEWIWAGLWAHPSPLKGHRRAGVRVVNSGWAFPHLLYEWFLAACAPPASLPLDTRPIFSGGARGADKVMARPLFGLHPLFNFIHPHSWQCRAEGVWQHPPKRRFGGPIPLSPAEPHWPWQPGLIQ